VPCNRRPLLIRTACACFLISVAAETQVHAVRNVANSGTIFPLPTPAADPYAQVQSRLARLDGSKNPDRVIDRLLDVDNEVERLTTPTCFATEITIRDGDVARRAGTVSYADPISVEAKGRLPRRFSVLVVTKGETPCARIGQSPVRALMPPCVQLTL